MGKSFIVKTLALGLFSLSLFTLTGTAGAEEATMQTGVDKSLAASQAFLAQNKNQPGVVTLPDGLQYKIVTQGKGQSPQESDIVTVHYDGKLIDGSEFDSSYKRGEPTSFPVNGVIPGWTEALKMMKPGSTWMLYIPPQLAYGEQGAPPLIGPNQALIFKVELLSVAR